MHSINNPPASEVSNYGSPAPAVHRVLSPVSSTVSSAFPTGKLGRRSASVLRITTSRRGVFEAADIPLCSGLQVCSPPRSFLPLRILPQGSRGFYVRAYRAPSHAPDMLTVRIQVIDGTGTCTLSDSQPCRLLLSTIPPISRVGDWRAGVGRSLCLPVASPFRLRVSQHLDHAAFPVPATSNAACGFPTLRSPVCFVPRFMGPITLGRLSAWRAELGSC